ncbi:MAG: hypothetical protein AB7V04_06445 [Desulfomonilaceae bacterium]
MARKKLVPLKDHPLFQEMIGELQKQTPDRIQAFRETIENDGTMPTSTDREKSQEGPTEQADNND